jgi:hypothetical protein
MSFPSTTGRGVGRTRSSSFNHSAAAVIRRQQSDSTFQHFDPPHQHRLNRRPSFDSHHYQPMVILPKPSHSNFLSVSNNVQVASSIDDDSGSEEYDDENGSIYPPSQINTTAAASFDNVDIIEEFVGKVSWFN